MLEHEEAVHPSAHGVREIRLSSARLHQRFIPGRRVRDHGAAFARALPQRFIPWTQGMRVHHPSAQGCELEVR